ncbi:MAG TPA: phage portal protein [Solirubrobacter sp.]|nr:phage portal protein [Solirubrobacter sp.]
MGVVSRAVRGPARERSFSGGITLQSAFGGIFANRDTDAEVTVSAERALGLPAVGSAIRLISREVGTLPLITYEGDGEDRQRAKDDPTYSLLRRRPNDLMVASTCWKVTMRHVAGWGEAFLGKERVVGGRGSRIIGLWPIPPEKVVVDTKGGRNVYLVSTKDGQREYTADDVIHVVMDSHDGRRGLSPIAQHRQALGYELALQRYGGKSIGGRAIPSGFLKIKKSLGAGQPAREAKARIRQEWSDLYKDSALAHKIAVLDEDTEFVPISVPLVDAQFVEQRRYGLVVIAQIFCLPVHKLQGSTGDSLTYNTREGNQLEYLGNLRPYMGALEDALNGDEELFPAAAARYCEFLPEALLRVEAKTQAEIHQIETAKAPWKKPSEVRRERNLPAEPGFDYVPDQPSVSATAPDAGADRSTTTEGA